MRERLRFRVRGRRAQGTPREERNSFPFLGNFFQPLILLISLLILRERTTRSRDSSAFITINLFAFKVQYHFYSVYKIIILLFVSPFHML